MSKTGWLFCQNLARRLYLQNQPFKINKSVVARASAMISVGVLMTTGFFAQDNKPDAKSHSAPTAAHSSQIPQRAKSGSVWIGISTNELWGYKNSRNEWVITPQFLYAGEFADGIAKVWTTNNFGFIGVTGKFLESFQPSTNRPEYLEPEQQIKAAQQITGHSDEFIRGTYEMAPDTPRLDVARMILAALEKVTLRLYQEESKKATKADVVDSAGPQSAGLPTNEVQSEKASESVKTATRESLKREKRGLFWGYKNSQNIWAIPPKYTYAGEFANGVAKVWAKDGYGYINTNGSYIADYSPSGVRPEDDEREEQVKASRYVTGESDEAIERSINGLMQRIPGLPAVSRSEAISAILKLSEKTVYQLK